MFVEGSTTTKMVGYTFGSPHLGQPAVSSRLLRMRSRHGGCCDVLLSGQLGLLVCFPKPPLLRALWWVIRALMLAQGARRQHSPAYLGVSQPSPEVFRFVGSFPLGPLKAFRLLAEPLQTDSTALEAPEGARKRSLAGNNLVGTCSLSCSFAC